MHHPGPPRFAAVGDELELAPRDPDPEASYRWRVAERPSESLAAVGDQPVERFAPDAPGRYRLELDAPDGRHSLTVRVFASDRSASAGGDSRSGASGSVAERGDQPGASGSGSADGPGRADGRPLLHLEARVEGETVVVEADAKPNPDSGERPEDLAVEFLADDRDDFSVPDGSGDTLTLPLGALPERARVHAVAVGEDGYSVPDCVELTRDGGEVSVTRPYDPPAWAEDSRIYEIYVRTFADEGTTGANAPDGSDPAADRSPFEAITDRLDYLDDLGVDTLWLTPVLENDHADHGYNITDFFAIAEDLGGREDYEDLIEAAHERGMKVLFDLVLNHSARTHPFFRAASENPDSEYREWYEWDEHGDPGTYFDWEHIANFDYDHLPVRRHLLDAVSEWAAVADGFRCDMAWAVPTPFWRELRERVKAEDSDFLLLDETIPYIPDYQGGLFDMHFDSTTAFTLREVGRGDAHADELLDAIGQRRAVGFPEHAAFMLYAENHDEGRYVVECGDDAALAAAAALATLPGAPMLYAGQELGQRGRRDALAWEDARPEFREAYETLLDARAARPALQATASFGELDYDLVAGDPERVVGYVRECDAERLAVVLNFGADSATVSPVADTDGTDVVTGEDRRTAEGLRVDDWGVFELPP